MDNQTKQLLSLILGIAVGYIAHTYDLRAVIRENAPRDQDVWVLAPAYEDAVIRYYHNPTTF
jgi:hypothetical protein